MVFTRKQKYFLVALPAVHAILCIVVAAITPFDEGFEMFAIYAVDYPASSLAFPLLAPDTTRAGETIILLIIGTLWWLLISFCLLSTGKVLKRIYNGGRGIVS